MIIYKYVEPSGKDFTTDRELKEISTNSWRLHYQGLYLPFQSDIPDNPYSHIDVRMTGGTREMSEELKGRPDKQFKYGFEGGQILDVDKYQHLMEEVHKGRTALYSLCFSKVKAIWCLNKVKPIPGKAKTWKQTADKSKGKIEKDCFYLYYDTALFMDYGGYIIEPWTITPNFLTEWTDKNF